MATKPSKNDTTNVTAQILEASKAKGADSTARFVRLAKTPSEGGVLRQLAVEIVGAAIGALAREEENWSAKSVWNDTWCPHFYNEATGRERPALNDKGEDQYGNAVVKLGKLGLFAAWSADDKARIMEWMTTLNTTDGTRILGITHLGSLANELTEKFKKVAPTEAECKAHWSKKIADKRAAPKQSELKAASVVLVNALGKIATASDYDSVTKAEPDLATLAKAAAKAVSEYGTRAATYFAARAAEAAEARKAANKGKPKKGKKKGDTSELNAAQRNEIANKKFGVLAPAAATGSNGTNKRQRGTTLDA
jgi:hypothetical protein